MINDRVVSIQEEEFRIVYVEDMTPYPQDEQAYSQVAGEEALQAILEEYPELEDELALVPSFELALAEASTQAVAQAQVIVAG